MMTVRLRVWRVIGNWLLRERGGPRQAVSRLPMRCHLTDLDINLHMNNTRYLGIMDVGRYHLLLVSGLGYACWLRRWRPVVVRAEVDYKRSLKLGDSFVLETSLERLGQRSSVLLQRFWRGDELVAEGRVTTTFLSGGKSQPLEPMQDEFGFMLPKLPYAGDDTLAVGVSGSPT